MKTLVIGSKGMLGQAFLKLLKEMGWEHQGLDREEIDITDARQVDERVSDFGPKLIINTAAYNAVDKARGEPEIVMAVNGLAVGYLAEAAKKSGAIFIHFSSDYVFDGLNKEGYNEEAKPNPVSVYGESKLAGEEALQKAAKEDGFEWYLIRTSRLFGPPGISQGTKKSFPATMIDLAKEREEISGIDAEVSSPTFVNDLVKQVLEIIESQPSGIYHLTNSGTCTWYEYAKAALESVGLQTKIKPVGADAFPRKAKRPAYSVLLSTKLPPMRPWQEALDEFLG